MGSPSPADAVDLEDDAAAATRRLVPAAGRGPRARLVPWRLLLSVVVVLGVLATALAFSEHPMAKAASMSARETLQETKGHGHGHGVEGAARAAAADGPGLLSIGPDCSGDGNGCDLGASIGSMPEARKNSTGMREPHT
ncbi:unnamed protein product [Prorocentrum cordatum]|uniref:Uncharacterized protein n=1 Tax=Prorocentrum cordatum TaxID=2364126 RepID=A0ABN9YBD7_9DINO|nr:unnamed protein product [Polarella glacialis]|mmetsp:Transcript_20195/g.52960  ORF Transcript_20195/g.52960 Transcript_20195/m.52960 type:complete len:139 (-) Transcript_20195:368-784(-)